MAAATKKELADVIERWRKETKRNSYAAFSHTLDMAPQTVQAKLKNPGKFSLNNFRSMDAEENFKNVDIYTILRYIGMSEKRIYDFAKSITENKEER